jgi:predicted S18 family serine protease
VLVVGVRVVVSVCGVDGWKNRKEVFNSIPYNFIIPALLLLDMKKSLILIIFSLLFTIILLTGSGGEAKQAKILAVTETGNGTYAGSSADLFLDLQSGKGRVFIDTFPASKLDTQMSTRLAKNLACKFADKNCEKYDFFYTIRSGSVIVGGPSASAAVAVVTVAALENLPVRSDVALTGTISSGYLIGPVGGLQQKIDAAALGDMKVVLIPQGTREQSKDNITTDLVLYGKHKGVEVLEVGRLDQVLEVMTGSKRKTVTPRLVINKEYKETMKFLSDRLCQRNAVMQTLLAEESLNESVLLKEEYAKNLTNKAADAFKEKDYYSSASYCFGANTQLRQLLFSVQNPEKSELEDLQNETEQKIQRLQSLINQQEISTITDLQAYMIVKERLLETKDLLDDIGDIEKEKNDLAYALERFNSALAWSKFFDVSGRNFKLDEKSLQESCVNKLSEVEEYFRYLDHLLPGMLSRVEKDIKRAREFQYTQDHVMCLFKASLARANLNLVAATMGVKEEQLSGVIQRKRAAVERSIIEQQDQDIFPILGYSYYEYAKSLQEEDKISALLYLEYALELSNLDMYFTRKQLRIPTLPKELVLLLLAGVFIGLLVSELHVVWSRALVEEKSSVQVKEKQEKKVSKTKHVVRKKVVRKKSQKKRKK